MTQHLIPSAYAGGQYVLPPLPYPTDALEPLLDAETLILHHDKHHAAYVAGANNARETLRRVSAGEMPATAAPAACRDLAFNLAGHILHCLYWENLSPVKQALPNGELTDALYAEFGSYEGFLRQFRSVTTAVQGSGWGVLGVEPAGGRLCICAVHRHQDALLPGFRPLLVCDVWEHAYYLGYRNRRADYIEAFLNMINWEAVACRYHCCHE